MEADLFISYFTSDHLSQYFQPVVEKATTGELELLVSSEVYDDITSALRSQKASLERIVEFVHDMRAIPHTSLPVTLDVAITALTLYLEHGGSRRLHYFDSFHVATSQLEKLPLLTSDKFILTHTRELDIKVFDPRVAVE